MNQTLLIILPMLVAFFWLLQFAIERKKNVSKKFLTLYLGLLLINYMAHASFFNKQYALYSILDSIWVFTSLSAFPIFYCYIRLLTKDVKKNLRWIWILTPAILLSLFSAILYILMNPEDVSVFIHGIMYKEVIYPQPYSLLVQLQILRLYLFQVIFSIEVILTVYFSMKLMIEFKNEVKSLYPYSFEDKLAPLNWLFVFLIFTSITSFISNIFGKSYFIINNNTLFIPSILHSAHLFALGYIGNKQSFTIEHFIRHKEAYNRNKSSLASLHERNNVKSIKSGNHIINQLHSLMEEKQVFKDAELKISDLAHMLGSNRTYVSHIINEEMQTTFNDFVNTYRVKYAEELLRSDKSELMPLSDIGLDSGFSSSSTFYRIFKNKNGVSPGVYRNQIKN